MTKSGRRFRQTTARRILTPMNQSDSTPPSNHPQSRVGMTIVLALVTACFVGAWIYKIVLPEMHEFKYDFAPYYAAWFSARTGHVFYETNTGEAGLHGSVFADVKDQMGIEEDFSAYIYPPQFAWLGSKITHLPYRTCQTLWVWLNASMWLGCVCLLLGRRLWVAPRSSAFVVVAALLYPPMAYSLSLGQINILLFAMIVASWWLVRERRDFAGGIPIGLAALIKPHIGLILIYFLWTRRWKAAGSCVATALALTLATLAALGSEPFVTYITDVLPKISTGQAYIANQSAYGVLARWFVSDPDYLFADRLMGSHPFLDPLSLLVSLAIIAATFWAIPRHSRSRAAVSAGYAAIICSLLLANKIATIHHFTWVWLALSYCVTTAEDHPRPRRAELAAFAVGAILIFMSWKLFPWFTGQSGVWRLLACPTFAGTSIIWVCLLRRLRRASHRESVVPGDNCPAERKDCAI